MRKRRKENAFSVSAPSVSQRPLRDTEHELRRGRRGAASAEEKCGVGIALADAVRNFASGNGAKSPRPLETRPPRRTLRNPHRDTGVPPVLAARNSRDFCFAGLPTQSAYSTGETPVSRR